VADCRGCRQREAVAEAVHPLMSLLPRPSSVTADRDGGCRDRAKLIHVPGLYTRALQLPARHRSRSA